MEKANTTNFTLQASSLAAEYFQLPHAAVRIVEGFVQVFCEVMYESVTRYYALRKREYSIWTASCKIR